MRKLYPFLLPCQFFSLPPVNPWPTTNCCSFLPLRHNHARYDAENRLIKVDNGNTSTFVYDGEGKRFSKTNSSSINSGGNTPDPSGETDFVYDAAGHLVHTEAPNSGTGWRGEVWLGNRHLATYAGNLMFDHADWLGTERNRDQPDSNAPQHPSNQNITGLPFGDWIDNSLGLSFEETPLNFTGQYHDFESDLDYFQARYYNSNFGRFMSPDPLGGHQEDPQTLNRYSYARNNPLNLTDPAGLDFNLTCSGPDTTTCKGGLQGTTTTTTDADGHQTSTFTATVISNDKNGNLVDQNGNQYNATVSGAGVSFSQAGSNQSSMGVFINGTNPTTVQDSTNFPGFTFNFTYSNMASGVNAGGTFKYNGTYGDAEAALVKAGFEHYLGDAFDPFHLSSYSYGAVDFRSAGAQGTGVGSGHFTVREPRTILEHGIIIPLTSTTPTTGTLHLGEHNVYNGGLIDHTIEVLKYIFH